MNNPGQSTRGVLQLEIGQWANSFLPEKNHRVTKCSTGLCFVQHGAQIVGSYSCLNGREYVEQLNVCLSRPLDVNASPYEQPGSCIESENDGAALKCVSDR